LGGGKRAKPRRGRRDVDDDGAHENVSPKKNVYMIGKMGGGTGKSRWTLGGKKKLTCFRKTRPRLSTKEERRKAILE